MIWKKVKISEVLKQYRIEHKVQNDKVYKQVSILNNGSVVVRGEKIGKEIGRKRQFVIDIIKFPNTLLFTRQLLLQGSIGLANEDVNHCIVTENMPMFSVDVSRVTFNYLRLFLKSDIFKRQVAKIELSGSAQKSIHERTFLNLEIPLPSIQEQNEVVAKFSDSNSHNELLTCELTHQLTLVKKLRQQLLQDAVQGKLVEQNKKDEPASELLKKIKAERLNRDVALARPKKEKELPPIKPEEIPFEIPENWVWCRINELVYDLKNDLRTGPFGTALNKSEHKLEGIPVWGIESISKDGHFTNINKIFVTEAKANNLKSFGVKGGDLIISRSGTIGELCMLPREIKYGLLSTNLMKISVNSTIILPEYFCHIIKGGRFIKEMLSEFCSGSTRLFLTQSILLKLLFPLPPLSEQNRIVQKLDELMQYCNELEASIKQSVAQNEELLQQVLREALRKEPVEV